VSKDAHWQGGSGASAQRSQSQQQPSGQSQSSQSSGASSASAESDEQFDPVCGMSVDVNDELVEHYEHNGKTYYFCSADCRQQYEASPDAFEV
jgi:Cu+-exporting ATPase